jgi:3-methyladenine DNA glycosylase AlkD
MEMKTIIHRLEECGNADAVKGMARFGINPEKVFGVSMPDLRSLAKEIGVDHDMAGLLWKMKYRETMILSSLIDDPTLVDENQLNSMVKDFYDWEVCDQTIMNLMQKTPFAWDYAAKWCEREEEFVRRAGFVLIARLAVSEKEVSDDKFRVYFRYIKKHAVDERNFVKKAVNWALRQIGKQSILLNKEAIKLAEDLQTIESRAARWIAADAIRELKSPAVQQRLRKKNENS